MKQYFLLFTLSWLLILPSPSTVKSPSPSPSPSVSIPANDTCTLLPYYDFEEYTKNYVKVDFSTFKRNDCITLETSIIMERKEVPVQFDDTFDETMTFSDTAKITSTSQLSTVAIEVTNNDSVINCYIHLTHEFLDEDNNAINESRTAYIDAVLGTTGSGIYSTNSCLSPGQTAIFHFTASSDLYNEDQITLSLTNFSRSNTAAYNLIDYLEVQSISYTDNFLEIQVASISDTAVTNAYWSNKINLFDINGYLIKSILHEYESSFDDIYFENTNTHTFKYSLINTHIDEIDHMLISLDTDIYFEDTETNAVTRSSFNQEKNSIELENHNKFKNYLLNNN